MPLSKVSTVMQELENRLGTTLFHRKTRGMSPTDNGLQYLDVARTLLE
jgi:DNA-binding transcriptional LysR family regulator